ncbi:MAG: hypothetical protein ACLT0Y_04105 [Christensenellales bacterium]
MTGQMFDVVLGTHGHSWVMSLIPSWKPSLLMPRYIRTNACFWWILMM